MHLALAKRLLPAASLLILCVFFASRSPNFLTLDNFFSIANQYAYLMIIGFGATVVIVAGGIDLSVGSVLALSSILAAHLIAQREMPVWTGVLAGLSVGAVAGLVNGLIITRLKVPAFIATLGMLMIARGLTYRIAQGVSIDGLPDSFNYLANGRPFGIPFPLILITLTALFVGFLLTYTRFGRYVYATGANSEAARFSGVRVGTVSIWVYVLGGLLAGLGGLIQAARLGTGDPNIGIGDELDIITAVVVGGASLSGGEGRISGTIIGALLIAVLRNGSNLIGVDPFDQKAYIGILIIAAVAFDRWLRTR
ncbi:MAG: ABC transporter permease [Armatimonadaceae bacterium]